MGCDLNAQCGSGPSCVVPKQVAVDVQDGVPCNGRYTNLTCATGTVCCGAETLTPHCLEPDQNTCCSDNTTNVAIVCDTNYFSVMIQLESFLTPFHLQFCCMFGEFGV